MQTYTIKPKIILNAEKLSEAQRKAKMSDVSLSHQSGLSVSQIWRAKNDKCNIGGEFVAGILFAFPGKSFNDFFAIAKPIIEDKKEPSTFYRHVPETNPVVSAG